MAIARILLCTLLMIAAAGLWCSLPASIAAAQAALDVGGPFTLIDQHGRAFSSEALAGRPYAIFFGFTNCPDVCPTTLLEMSNHLAKLGPDADRLAVVFVTVDTERDTPERLRAYLSTFDPRIIGLTGSPEQVAVAAKAWKSFP
jgi:protein SCO1